MTGENLGYKPDPVQKAKFEYSPLGQVFNKELDSNEKQEGFLEKLKNIEGKNEQQLDLIRDQGDRRLNLLGKINTCDTKAIEFGNEKSKELKRLKVRIIEEEIKNE